MNCLTFLNIRPMIYLCFALGSCSLFACRSIKRAKEWKVLVKKMSLKQRDLAGMIVAVCVLLNNLKPPLTETQNVSKTAGEGIAEHFFRGSKSRFSKFRKPTHGGYPGCVGGDGDHNVYCVCCEC